MIKTNKMEKVELAWLLFALALAAFLHLRYIREIYYDHDVALHLRYALDLLRGRGWYAFEWDSKPPGIYIIFSTALSLFGRSFTSIYITAFLADSASIIFIYLLGRYVLREELKFYFLLPVFYALLCVSEGIQGHSANLEKFLAVFEIAGMFFLGLAYKKKKNIFYLSAGLLFGMGFLIKQPALITFASGMLFILAAKIIDKEPLKPFIKKIIVFTLAFVTPLSLIAVYFFKTGVFDMFIKCMFLNNIKYVQDISMIRTDEIGRSLHRIWNALNIEIIIFGLFSSAGLIYSCLKRSALRFLILSWFVIWALALVKFAIFRHHFIQIIAPMVCLSMFGASDIYKRFANRMILCVLFFLLLFIPFLHILGPLIIKKQMIRPAYGAKERFLVSQYLKQHANPADKIFVWDDFDAGAIYLWSGLASASNLSSKYTVLPKKLVPFSHRAIMGDYKLNQRRLLLDLSKETPAYIIVVEDIKSELGREAKDFPEFLEILQSKYRLKEQVGQDPKILIYGRI